MTRAMGVTRRRPVVLRAVSIAVAVQVLVTAGTTAVKLRSDRPKHPRMSLRASV
jgi:hypothetical protein